MKYREILRKLSVSLYDKKLSKMSSEIEKHLSEHVIVNVEEIESILGKAKLDSVSLDDISLGD